MELKDKIMAILGDLCGAETDELSADLNLFEAGLLDSFGLIELILSLEETFGIALPIEDIPRAQIDTPQKIVELVRKAKETQ